MAQAGAIPEDHYDAAHKLLDALGRRAGDWPGPLNWVFRGHGDSEWRLLPSSHRKPDGSIIDHVPARTRAENECRSISRFAFEAAVAGLWLPEVGHALLERINVDRNSPALVPGPDGRRVRAGSVERAEALDAWPPREVWGVLALAQHHEWPTCLLDWTYDPKRAAYFAARSAARMVRAAELAGKAYDGPERIAVWALERRNVESTLKLGRARVALVHGSRHQNPRLLAQDGLFTVIQHLEDDHLPDCLALEEFIRRANPKDSLRPYIKKLTLPATEAPRLLRLLNEEFINAATICPGYEGVVQALKEEDLWNKIGA